MEMDVGLKHVRSVHIQHHTRARFFLSKKLFSNEGKKKTCQKV